MNRPNCMVSLVGIASSLLGEGVGEVSAVSKVSTPNYFTAKAKKCFSLFKQE